MFVLLFYRCCFFNYHFESWTYYTEDIFRCSIFSPLLEWMHAFITGFYLFFYKIYSCFRIMLASILLSKKENSHSNEELSFSHNKMYRIKKPRPLQSPRWHQGSWFYLSSCSVIHNVWFHSYGFNTTTETPDSMLLFQAEVIGMTQGFSSNKIIFGPRSPHPKLTFSFQWLEGVLI